MSNQPIRNPYGVAAFRLKPPDPDRCQQCAGVHEPHEPHNQESMYWQEWFYAHFDRWPTWEDAMAHCDDRTRFEWVDMLLQLNEI